jgi:hypothetical protein
MAKKIQIPPRKSCCGGSRRGKKKKIYKQPEATK